MEAAGEDEAEAAWVEEARGECESEKQWLHRRQFLLRNAPARPAAANLDRLLAYSMVWANHVFMGCRYPLNVMEKVLHMAKGIKVIDAPIHTLRDDLVSKAKKRGLPNYDDGHEEPSTSKKKVLEEWNPFSGSTNEKKDKMGGGVVSGHMEVQQQNNVDTSESSLNLQASSSCNRTKDVHGVFPKSDCAATDLPLSDCIPEALIEFAPTSLPFIESSQSLPLIGSAPTSLPLIELAPSSFPLIESKPTLLPLIDSVPMSLPLIESVPTSLPLIKTEPTLLPIIENVSKPLPPIESAAPSLPLIETTPISLPPIEATAMSLPLIESATTFLPLIGSTATSLPLLRSTALPFIETKAVPRIEPTLSSTSLKESRAAALNLIKSVTTALPRTESAATALPQITSATAPIHRIQSTVTTLPLIESASNYCPQQHAGSKQETLVHEMNRSANPQESVSKGTSRTNVNSVKTPRRLTVDDAKQKQSFFNKLYKSVAWKLVSAGGFSPAVNHVEILKASIESLKATLDVDFVPLKELADLPQNKNSQENIVCELRCNSVYLGTGCGKSKEYAKAVAGREALKVFLKKKVVVTVCKRKCCGCDIEDLVLLDEGSRPTNLPPALRIPQDLLL